MGSASSCSSLSTLPADPPGAPTGACDDASVVVPEPAPGGPTDHCDSASRNAPMHEGDFSVEFDQHAQDEVFPEKLGLQVFLHRSKDHPLLKVKAIKEDGLVPRWNARYPDRMIKPGDYIISANGQAGSGKRTLEIIDDTISHRKGALVLAIRHGQGPQK